MSSPTVACICLTKDRPEMLKRAVAAFRAQAYEQKRLLILDTGAPGMSFDGDGIIHAYRPEWKGFTIGHLRNEANYLAIGLMDADILAHADDDDWQGPNRLTEQVALLQSGDFDAVGYSEMLFWDSRKTEHVQRIAKCMGLGGYEERGEAWSYRHPLPNYALGTSLLYHRRTWEAKPFADLPQSGDDVCEDFVFQSGLRVKSVSSLSYSETETTYHLPSCHCGTCRDLDGRQYPVISVRTSLEPRMIASIHGDNSRKASYADALRRAEMFTRVPDWDQFCRDKMRLP